MFNQAAYSDSDNPANTRLFATGWSGVLTFEEIMTQCTPFLRRAILKFDQVAECDLEDMLQRGFTALWRQLQDNPNLLADADMITAAHLIKAQCRNPYMQRLKREPLLGNPRLETPWEEYTVSAGDRQRREVWAAFATQTDLRIDIERILGELAEYYLSKRLAVVYLMALYGLTTSVYTTDLYPITGVSPRIFKRTLHEVRRDLRARFADLYPPTCGWWDKYQQGDRQGAAWALQKCQHSPLLPALRWLLAGAPADERHTLHIWHITRARRVLERAYHTNH